MAIVIPKYFYILMAFYQYSLNLQTFHSRTQGGKYMWASQFPILVALTQLVVTRDKSIAGYFAELHNVFSSAWGA